MADLGADVDHPLPGTTEKAGHYRQFVGRFGDQPRD
jgi:hypothetical protein